MRIRQILQSKRLDVVVIAPDSTIRAAVNLMKQERVGSLVVIDPNRRLLGVLSERDVIHSLASEGAELLSRPVDSIMRTDGPVVRLEDTVQFAMQLMTEKRARHVPVVETRRIIGLVSVGDIIKSRLKEKIQENGVLQDIARIHALVE
jgi:CBS domain-containing protein